ncbi:MAG: GNAT family N-acetyltransferase [Betaproteobacteria bacterium]|nr:GNAT family N-acetyltransferase [Betaproteobacteria bacterium]
MTTDAASSISIRTLAAGERKAIEHFFLEELDDIALYWRFFRTMTPMTVHAYVAQMRFGNGCVVFGAFYGERLVGVAELSAVPGSEMCAENRPGALSCAELGIAVSNQLRHKGVGRALLDYLLMHGWRRGLKRIQLSSLRDNRPMLGLAEQLGFRALREESGEVIMQALRPADWPQEMVRQSPAAAPEPALNCTAKTSNARCR